MSEDTKWKMMPSEPTDAMLLAGCGKLESFQLMGKAIYEAMWEAAPTPPAPEAISMEPTKWAYENVPNLVHKLHAICQHISTGGTGSPSFLSVSYDVGGVSYLVSTALSRYLKENPLGEQLAHLQSEVERLRGEREDLTEFLNLWVHDSRLQTLGDRQQFRKEAIAKIERK